TSTCLAPSASRIHCAAASATVPRTVSPVTSATTTSAPFCASTREVSSTAARSARVSSATSAWNCADRSASSWPSRSANKWSHLTRTTYATSLLHTQTSVPVDNPTRLFYI